MIKMEIMGGEQLVLALRQLGDNKAIDNAMKKAMYAGAVLIRNTAKSLVPVKSGYTKRNIVIRRRGGGRRMPTVTIKSEGQLSYILEHGTAPRILKKPRWAFFNGKWYWLTHTGQIAKPAHPFMRPAFENNKEMVLKAIMDRSWTAVKQEARKLARKRMV